jgi:hypothetical protein
MEEVSNAGRKSLHIPEESAKTFEKLFFEIRLLNYKETAELLGCTDEHVSRLVVAGELSPVPIGKGERGKRIQVRDLLRFIDKRKVIA